MKLLLTGATGFVGRNLLLEVLRKGGYERIFLPVRSRKKLEMQLAADGYDHVPASLEIFEGDHRHWHLPAEAATAEHTVHSAGVIFARTEREYRDVNVDGTVRLIESLQEPQRVVVLSSLSAAGPSAPKGAKVEGDPDAPLTWYGKSKLAMERKLASDFVGLSYICLRPPMIFGPRDAATLPLFKMANKRLRFKAGWVLKEYSVLGVRDLVEAILYLLNSQKPWPQNPAPYYYVTHPVTITDRELIASAARLSGRHGWTLPVPQWVLQVASYFIDSLPTWRATIPSLSVDRAKEIWPNRWVAQAQSLQRDFDWIAKQSFEQALRDTRNWYVRSGQLKDLSRPAFVAETSNLRAEKTAE